MPISSDFTINLTDRTIYHSAGTTIYSVNELYSWLMDYFDENTTIDDPIPMSAQTPTQYTLVNGWYINDHYYNSYHYLNGGSLKSTGFDALTYSYGIRKLVFAAGGYVSAVVGDLGREVGYSGGTPTDTGTLLDFDNTTRTWFVRVDDTGDTFANTATAIDLDNGTGTGAGTLTSASTTGESVWANIYTIGTIQSNTHMYVYQNDAEITPWWGSGHIDVIIEVKELGNLIDLGNLTVFARQYSKLYDHFTADASDGSRIPIPIATFSDANNPTGYRQMTLTTASATFTPGEIIQDDSDATIQGIVTSSTGTAPNITLEYYLFNAAQTDFSGATGSFTGQTSSSTATAVAPTNNGPASVSGVTFTFGATSQNLNNGNGSQPYDCTIDTNNYPLEELYEYLKYLTRYGSSTSLNGHLGEDYFAVGDIRLPYDAQSGNFSEGLTVTGGNSGATGIIVADHDAGATGALVLRDVSGSFEDNETITDTSTGSATVDLSLGLDEITPSKQSPFGTFAGGKFFAARGIWLSNVYASDANNYQLIDSTGTIQTPPQTIAITINGVVSGDKVAVFRTTGNNEIVDREIYSSHATDNDIGDNTFIVQEVIDSDTPTAGVLRVVDNSLNRETRYTYTGWSGSTFTGISPTLVANYDGTDTAYVPFIDTTSTGTSVSVSTTYDIDRYVLVVVRFAGFVPFKVTGQVTSNGFSATAIKTTDSVYQ
jgi:hypothetical protein